MLKLEGFIIPGYSPRGLSFRVGVGPSFLGVIDDQVMCFFFLFHASVFEATVSGSGGAGAKKGRDRTRNARAAKLAQPLEPANQPRQ